MSKAKTTEFVEYKEELLPKYYPGIVDALWYPPVDEDADPDDEGGDDDDNQEEPDGE